MRVKTANMNRLALGLFTLLIPLSPAFAAPPELLEVERIWDRGAHNAFTDLVRFDNQWYCTFREAEGHVNGDGRIRVIHSADGETWESAALIEESGIDLRDPKLSITPDGRLMLLMGGSVYEDGEYVRRQPRVAFSEDGSTWTDPERVLSEGDWLWRVTWHGGAAYGISYHDARENGARITLYKSTDGRNYREVTPLTPEGRPNEATLRFLPDGTMVALIRRESGSQNGLIGQAGPPYTDWTWNETGHRLGGPDFLRAPDGQLWAGSRSYPGGAKTVLARMTLDSYEPVITLPSGGDTSYPGLAWHNGLLWMSYYSSHEDKTSIYLAKFRVPVDEENAYRYNPREVGDYMPGWLLCGPFPGGDRAGTAPRVHRISNFETDFLANTGGEANPSPEPGQSFTYDGTTYTWEPHLSESGAIDLDDAIGRTQPAVGYAYAEIESPAQRSALLSLGTNDGNRVWLNGERIWDWAGGRGLTLDEDRIPIVLRKGTNKLLIKIEEHGNQWGLAARLRPLTKDTFDDFEIFRPTITQDGNPMLTFRFSPSLIGTVIDSVHVQAHRRNEPDDIVWESTLDRAESWPIGVDASQFGRYTLQGHVQFADGFDIDFSAPFVAGKPQNHVLFADGQTAYRIVLGPNTSESEQFAAVELQRWMQDVSGAKAPIVQNPLSLPEKSIVIGYNEHTERILGGDASEPAVDDESFTYRNAGPTILIWGGKQRGTMYGVMSFLERELGVRFYTPAVTATPEKARHTFSYLQHSESPTVRVRNDYYHEAFNPEWAAHNRINGSTRYREQPGGIQRYRGVHTFYRFLPPDEYFDTHPEYFSLIDGERTHERAQLCLTNPDVLDIITEELRERMRNQPEYLIYSVSQNDWHGACECADCQAIVEREGSEAGLMVWFVNQVAERIEDEFPNKYVGTLAYQYTRHPPRHIKPRDNVVIRLCSIECCFAHDFKSCPQNQAFLQDLRGWADIAPHLYIWDYVVNFSRYIMPYPNFNVLAENIKTFQRNNAIGIKEQGAYQSRGAEFAELRMYVLAKLLWNPNQDVDAIVDDFMHGYYGRAGQYIRAYFDLLHGQITPNTHFGLGMQPDHPIFTPTFIQKAQSLFDQAETVADNQEILHRVEMARLPLMFLRCKRNPHIAVIDGTYQRFTEITERENITHYAESGANHRRNFHREMEAAFSQAP